MKLALPNDGVTALACSALGGRRPAADQVQDPLLNAMLEKIKFPQCNISAVIRLFVLSDLPVASRDPRRRRRGLQFEYERATFLLKYGWKY
ncbi:hypothetical protein [Collimonas sp. PA-H2]|uniref:hypothetical protein n=1 Tax=Collimonas sp. PA-H2 TaxID=1881062 RepID=UPI00117CADE8|nr:hypothetical protein [Collimonas sp. PA-H2]